MDKRKPKHDIPMVVIDTRGNRKKARANQTTQELRKVEPEAIEFLPTLQLLLSRLFHSLQKPLLALKFRFFRFLDHIFDDVDIPWIKLIVVGALTFMVFKKNVQFNFAFNAPDAEYIDEEAALQTSTFSALDANPYAPASAATLHEKQSYAYIKQFAPVAIAEMKKFGIPASIKMAQALIESRAGHSRLAKNNNNHFGMKCFSKNCKKGHCTNATDDHHKDFFRTFGNSWESWRAHSKLISQGRYAHLQNYGKDYKKWAAGLKKAGYATDRKYASKLTNIIEKYKLYQLDKQ